MEEHNKVEFEVISNSDKESENNIDSENDCYSQNDKSFLFELYRENRELLKELTEKNKIISELENRSIYLKNSNIFWLYCYVGTAFLKVLSLSYT